MTSTFAEVQRAPKATKRRAAHRARIDKAPEGRRREMQVLAWLRSELANGGSLDDLISFIDSMNAKAIR
ncbi:hypothetical protein GCM10010399_92820 [Dactylosporangium fulvum]|uniref:Uncharacterized protein n=1 Tax=Dactylosporangium fulvum TaxID=53359 RepID=A0ABY5W9G1_9ACTN|nr:hypothetical protein [Dactylosporangium fulvum]UWP85849.1 hypothetical protein Dfulv_17020 [Dactylosporangium fulvum]